MPLWRYHLDMLRRPRQAMELLLSDPRRLGLSFRAVGQVALLYAVAIFLIHLGDGVSLIPAWLALPEDELFLWESLFVGPVTIGCWLLSAAVVQVLARAAGGHGSFEDTLAALGLAVAVPTYISGVPDLLSGLARALGWVDPAAWADAIGRLSPESIVLWTYMSLYLIVLVALFLRAVSAAHRLGPLVGVAVGIAGVVVYQGVYFVFIR